MKKIIGIALLSISMNCSYSQSVTVDISIDWKNSIVFEEKYGTKHNPYLNITYKNNTQTPIYLLKLIRDNSGYPSVLPIGEFEAPIWYMKNMHIASDFKQNVYIINDNKIITCWDIKYAIDSLNSIYHDADGLIESIYYSLSDTLPNADYYLKDITSTNILTKFRNDFVFLNAGEKCTVSSNLIAFQLLGGDYTFSVKNDSFQNSVSGDPYWDEILKSWVYQNFPLPEIINGYRLYSGTFKTNEVHLKLKGIYKKD